MTRSGPVGVGFIGTGMISNNYQENLSKFPDIEVIVLGDLNVDLTESIAPKSDQLNAEDLLTGPRTFTVEKVTAGTTEQPVDVHLVEFPGRPFKPFSNGLSHRGSASRDQYRQVECD